MSPGTLPIAMTIIVMVTARDANSAAHSITPAKRWKKGVLTSPRRRATAWPTSVPMEMIAMMRVINPQVSTFIPRW